MRWFLGLLLVVALITGALYGVGRFLLPNSLAVTRTVSIDRPRAAVFAMSNDLRIAKEWSPFYVLDPDADYSFGGDGPGAGQTMRWVSNVREVGNGRMSIVASTENEKIQSILELNQRAIMDSLMIFHAAGGKTAVAWTVTAECGDGWINVPCRYMNLVLRAEIQKRLDDGLAHLKRLAELLPDVDFEHLNPAFDTYEPQPFVYSVVETVTNDQGAVDQAEALGLDQVRNFMSTYGLTPSGPLMRVVTDYNATQNTMKFNVGFPFSGALPSTRVGVQIDKTPSGEAMHVLVTGTREQVRQAYAEMYAYLQAHRVAMREGGRPWEVVQDRGSTDGSTPMKIEIFVPLQ